MRRWSIIAVVAVVSLLIGVSGCAKKSGAPEVTPKVAPPVIGDAGVLKAGVDLTYPPFAGRDDGREAGIDVDVAAALAERLGLTLELVDVKPSDAATALATGEADIVLSVALTAESLGSVSLAGTYVTVGSAYFAAVEATPASGASISLQPELLTPGQLAVQTGSPAFWVLEEQYGAGAVQAYPTIRDAVKATSEGSATAVVGDAYVIAYIARDFPGIRFAIPFGTPVPLGVAVEPENTELGESVREQLDALAADGVLDAIRSKWVGDLPDFEVSPDASSTAEPSSTVPTP